MSSRTLLAWALLAALGPNTASAACPAPDRPAVEETDLTKRLNAHAEGSRVCLTTPSAYVEYLSKPGFYECRKGRWMRESNNECTKMIKAAGADTPPTQPPPKAFGNAGASPSYAPPIQNDSPPPSSVSPSAGPATAASPPGHTSNAMRPITGACKVTKTC